MLKPFVWSVALYGCETWTIGKQEKRRLMAPDNWYYRGMMRKRQNDEGKRFWKSKGIKRLVKGYKIQEGQVNRTDS